VKRHPLGPRQAALLAYLAHGASASGDKAASITELALVAGFVDGWGGVHRANCRVAMQALLARGLIQRSQWGSSRRPAVWRITKAGRSEAKSVGAYNVGAEGPPSAGAGRDMRPCPRCKGVGSVEDDAPLGHRQLLLLRYIQSIADDWGRWSKSVSKLAGQAGYGMYEPHHGNSPNCRAALQALERRGLIKVERAGDPATKRAKQYRLTKKGRSLPT